MRGEFDLMACDMATPLSRAHTVSIGRRASEAETELRNLGYDQAPVVDDDGRLVGWVLTARLGGRGFVASSLVPLAEAAVLSRESSVEDVIRLVGSERFIFLAGSKGIEEFVVPSDLDRQAVRAFLYMLVSEVEFRLAELVRQAVPSATIMQHFQPGSRKRYKAAQAKGLETQVVEYLYLSDYPQLVGSVPALRNLHNWSPEQQRSDLSSLNGLRTVVAHPSKSLTADFDATDVVCCVEVARRALQHLRPLTLG